MITYRYAEDKDLDKVLCLRYDCLKEVFNKDEKAFDSDFIQATRDFFINGKQKTLLAFDDGQTVACATIVFINVMPTCDHPTGRRAHIMNVYTAPKYRRQGIGKAMMNALIKIAKETKITELSLDTSIAGKRLYESVGFNMSTEAMVLNLESIK